jgi:hypothetical protein
MEETHPCRRQRRCGATITVGHPLSGGVGSPPYCLTSPTRRRDEELAEADGGSNGGEARPLLDTRWHEENLKETGGGSHGGAACPLLISWPNAVR